MAMGRKTKAYADIQANAQALVHGLAIAIDPSSGSTSSQPGYAVYRVGELIASGTLPIAYANVSLPDRLRALHNAVRKLYNMYDPDVLVYEDVPSQAYGRAVQSHASLLKALGAILAVPGPAGHVGITPVSWQSEARDTYVKGDDTDAVEIGWVAIEVARRIENGKNK